MPPKKTKAPTRRKSAKRAVAPKRAPKRAKPAKPKLRVAAPKPPSVEELRSKKMAERAAALVLDKKALDVVLLDVRGLTSYADYFVVASGESDRQVNAMADSVHETLKGEGHRLVGSEGAETGNWVLLDYGEVVVHLFQAEARAFYDLEGLWADAPRERLS